MRRCLLSGLVSLIAAALAPAQDGLYGTFIAGQKFIDMTELNSALATSSHAVVFKNNHWTFGGEGHMIVARHLMLGGKGMFIFEEEMLAADHNSKGEDTYYKFTAGMGTANLGYAFVGAGNRLRLYPQVGAGATTFLFQTKSKLDPSSEYLFRDAIVDDRMSIIQKIGFVLDLCVGLDWFVPLLELKALIPGLTFGPLLHAEAGYTFVPGDLPWKRDTDDLKAFADGELRPLHNPNLKFQGFHYNVGVGFGLTSSRD